MVTALVFAGGVGSRMKSEEIPKQFLEIEGKPIIIHTLQHFSEHYLVDHIVVVCIEKWIDELKGKINKFGIEKVIEILPGGKTGFQSIHSGLEYIYKISNDDDIVLICDGVRPILTEELISRCIEDTKLYGTAVPVTPSIDSVLYSEDGKMCDRNIERKNVYITQAPQGYKIKHIREAHDEAIAAGIEAVSSGDLMIQLGHKIHIFQGIRENIKVTTPEDLNVLRATKYYDHFKKFSREEFKWCL